MYVPIYNNLNFIFKFPFRLVCQFSPGLCAIESPCLCKKVNSPSINWWFYLKWNTNCFNNVTKDLYRGCRDSKGEWFNTNRISNSCNKVFQSNGLFACKDVCLTSSLRFFGCKPKSFNKVINHNPVDQWFSSSY